MSAFGIDFYLILVLLIGQTFVLGLFITLYFRKRQPAFLSLIISILFFVLSNILTLVFINRNDLYLDFFQALLAAAGLAPIVVFLEIFENGLSFTKRSSLSVMFLLVVGAINGAAGAIYDERLANFINLMAPMMYIAIGTFYLNTIKKVRKRIRFENQKKKIRKIRSGIYMTYIIPKFFIGAILGLTTLPVLLQQFIDNFLPNYSVDAILQTPEMRHIIAVTLNTFQTVGIVILSLPIIYSKSVFFMQSRKVSKLIVIDKDSTPVFEFQFEDENEETFDDELLKEAFTAIGSIMSRGGSAGSNLTTINFNELEIMTEIREDFSALLIVDRQTTYLKEGLEAFADDFVKIYPKNADLNEIRTQKLKYTAEKMIQKNFGLEQEEFDQIKEIVSIGYDKMADKYLKTRSEDVPEVKLLPDFMKRLPVGSRVLDAGCGAGEPITRLLSEKFKVTGVDISKKQIDIGREMLPYCEFIWQDMTTLTFPDEYFDGIVSYYAIPHVPREEHMGLLENFYRMLKPNGIVLICFGTSDEPGVVVDDFLGVKMYWSSFDAGTNIEMLKEVGYHVLWLKLIFDDITDEQHIFILAQKLVTDFVDEIEELEDIE